MILSTLLGRQIGTRWLLNVTKSQTQEIPGLMMSSHMDKTHFGKATIEKFTGMNGQNVNGKEPAKFILTTYFLTIKRRLMTLNKACQATAILLQPVQVQQRDQKEFGLVFITKKRMLQAFT